MSKVVRVTESQIRKIVSKVIKEGWAYMLDSDGKVIDYKPGMKMGAFGQKPKITDDEKGVRGPLTILKYAIIQQDWEMVKQASDELESYVNSKYSKPDDDEERQWEYMNGEYPED